MSDENFNTDEQPPKSESEIQLETLKAEIAKARETIEKQNEGWRKIQSEKDKLTQLNADLVAEFTKRQQQSQQHQNHNQDTGDFDQISDERQLKQYADRKAREIASQYSNGQITDADRDMALFDIQTQYADRKAEILTDKKLKQFQETNTSQQTATTRQSMFNQLFEEAGLNQDSEFRNKFVELGGQGFFDYEAVRNGDPNALKTALKVVKQLSGIQQPSKTEYNQGGGFTPPTGASGTDVTPTNDGQPKGYQIDPAIAKIIMERAGNEKLGKSVLNRISQSINSKKAS